MDCSLWKENLLGPEARRTYLRRSLPEFGCDPRIAGVTHMNPTALKLHHSNMRHRILQTALVSAANKSAPDIRANRHRCDKMDSIKLAVLLQGHRAVENQTILLKSREPRSPLEPERSAMA